MHSDNQDSRGRTVSAGASLSGTNLERAGDYNQRVLLQAIRVNGPLTRSDLVEITNLTPPTVANITKRLLTSELIVEAGRRPGNRGLPAMKLAINPDGCFSIGVNIDRDHITVVTLDLEGRIRARVSEEIAFALPDTVAAFVRTHLEKILGGLDIPRERVIGMGVAAPDDPGHVTLPHQPADYAVWDSVNVGKLFADIVPLPVFVENDAAAAAIGELQFGHGLQSPTFFYILITAALGGGLVIEGNYFRGARGRSGELGWIPLRERHGGARMLQEVVSISFLYEHLAAHGFHATSPEQLRALAEQGCAPLDKWIEMAADWLVDAMVAVNCLVNPDAVFIGGRLPENIVERLAARLNERMTVFRGAIPSVAPVRRAALSADAPAVGAGILPFTARLLPSTTVLMKVASA